MKTMIFGLFLLLAWRSGVDAQTPFYQGKSSILPGLYFDQLVGRSEVQFDYAKFSWIGSTDRSNNLVIVRADSPYKSIRDVRGASQAPKCAATGTGSVAYQIPRLLEETIGAKFNIVTGRTERGLN